MAELITQFFNGKTYSATDFVENNKNIMTNGVLSNTEYFKVLPSSNMTIAVTTGRGWVQGQSFNLPNTLAITLDSADGVLDRIDTVVIRLDTTTGAEKCECKVIKGTLGGGATAPIRNGTYYDLVIAYINVAHGTTAITSAMITDKRADNTLCGWSGAINAQQLQFDTKADKADVGDKATLTTTAKTNLVSAINECKTGVANANAISLQGKNISATAPSTGQVLQFDGTNYIPTTCGYVSGMYTGDGAASKNINVGFMPSLVVILGAAITEPFPFAASSTQARIVGVASPSYPNRLYVKTSSSGYGDVNMITVNANGFAVYFSVYNDNGTNVGSFTNCNGVKLFYIAFR